MDNPNADVFGIEASANNLDVYLKAYEENAFSFAVLIHILLDGNYHEDYIWESHNGNLLIGKRETNNGSIIEGTEELVTLEPQPDGTLKVKVSDVFWPEGSQVEIMIETFYMQDSSAGINMDTFSTGLFNPISED